MTSSSTAGIDGSAEGEDDDEAEAEEEDENDDEEDDDEEDDEEDEDGEGEDREEEDDGVDEEGEAEEGRRNSFRMFQISVSSAPNWWVRASLTMANLCLWSCASEACCCLKIDSAAFANIACSSGSTFANPCTKSDRRPRKGVIRFGSVSPSVVVADKDDDEDDEDDEDDDESRNAERGRPWRSSGTSKALRLLSTASLAGAWTVPLGSHAPPVPSTSIDVGEGDALS